MHLILIHKWRLESHDLAARLAEEHVAATKQVLGTWRVKDNSRVVVRRHLEGDTSW
jgi:hypothetical protein